MTQHLHDMALMIAGLIFQGQENHEKKEFLYNVLIQFASEIKRSAIEP